MQQMIPELIANKKKLLLKFSILFISFLNYFPVVEHYLFQSMTFLLLWHHEIKHKH